MWNVVGARWLDLSTSETFPHANVEWSKKGKIFSEQQFSVKNAFLIADVREEWPDYFELIRRVIATQITTHYNQCVHKSISEYTARLTVKQMGYSITPSASPVS